MTILANLIIRSVFRKVTTHGDIKIPHNIKYDIYCSTYSNKVSYPLNLVHDFAVLFLGPGTME